MGSKSKEGSEGSSKKKRKSEAASDVVEGKKRKEGKELSKASGGSSSRGEGTRVAIRVEKEAEGTSGTMLACFSNAPPPVADLQDGGIMLGCEAHGTRKRVLTGETKTLLFEGSDDCGTGSAFKYMVGLYDPDKGEVVVADPGPGVSGNVVSLRRRVKSMASGGTLGEMTKEQARDALVDVFGSKRVRSVYKQRKGQELEKEGTDVLGKLERELQVKKEESKAAHAAAATAGEDEGPSDLAPKCNMKASSPAEAYLRKDVIGEEEWESLAPVQILDMAKDPSGEAASMLPTYIRAQLPALLKTEDKKDRRKRAKLLMYAAFLVLFNALPSRFNKNAAVLREELGMPFAVANRALSSYAAEADVGFSRPQACRDRLLLALCVITMMFGDFQVNFGDLAQDLKLHPDKLATYFREIGAAVTKPRGAAHTSYIAKLAIPLTFPKRSRGPVKR